MKQLRWYKANAARLEVVNGRSADTGRPWRPTVVNQVTPARKTKAQQSAETTADAAYLDSFIKKAQRAGVLKLQEDFGRKYTY